MKNNHILLFLFALLFSMLTACGVQADIEYRGTECVVPDSSKNTYNSELSKAYSTIDSSTATMLGNRGPKGSRYENEDIDDEYNGAIKLAKEAKESQANAILQKYCVMVDDYYMVSNSIGTHLNEFDIKPSDTAVFHAVKRNTIHGNSK